MWNDHSRKICFIRFLLIVVPTWFVGLESMHVALQMTVASVTYVKEFYLSQRMLYLLVLITLVVVNKI